jgi:hypothetical protein
MDDEWDWDRSEVVDLDVTGDPQLDQFGYQSPRRDFTPPPSQSFDYLAQYRRDQAERERKRRAAVTNNLADTRRRNAERRGQQPQPVTPALAPHVAQAVERGAVGRQAGWYRVDMTPDGRTTWTPVDQPGDGPQMTVQQSPAPQWHPVELTEPGSGTQVW